MNNKEFMFIDLKEIKSYFDYYTFLKIYTKSSLDSRKIKYDRDNKEYLYKNNLKRIFPFWKINDGDKSYNNLSFKDFPLAWLKNQKKVWKIDKKLIPENKVDITSHIPNTFAIKTQFKLTAPYYSNEDDDFYIISNPCIKEHVFKVPIIRGSSWKGALLKAGIEIFKEDTIYENLQNIFRIFGVGNDTFRNIFDKSSGINENNLKLFLALEMGSSSNLNSDIKKFFDNYIKGRANNYQIIDTVKGRAIFYPTYFDKLSLELINPHNRKTKAGTNPIHYEVVPKDSKGDLQIVYIPFDGVTKSNDEIKKEAKQDLEFLQECIKRVAKNGIGAKTKLGWGRFEINNEIKLVWSKR